MTTAMYAGFLLLADVLPLPSPEPILGGSGWVGAGLLGAVLAWLCYIYLPSKDKQIKEFMEAKDAQLTAKDVQVREYVKLKDAQLAAKDTILREHMEAKDAQLTAILDAKWKLIESIGTRYTEAIAKVTDHCEEESRQWRVEMGHLTTAIQDLSEKFDRFTVTKQQ